MFRLCKTASCHYIVVDQFFIQGINHRSSLCVRVCGKLEIHLKHIHEEDEMVSIRKRMDENIQMELELKLEETDCKRLSNMTRAMATPCTED